MSRGCKCLERKAGDGDRTHDVQLGKMDRLLKTKGFSSSYHSREPQEIGLMPALLYRISLTETDLEIGTSWISQMRALRAVSVLRDVRKLTETEHLRRIALSGSAFGSHLDLIWISISTQAGLQRLSLAPWARCRRYNAAFRRFSMSAWISTSNAHCISC